MAKNVKLSCFLILHLTRNKLDLYSRSSYSPGLSDKNIAGLGETQDRYS